MLSQKNLREMQRKLSKYFLSTAIAQIGILSVVCVFSFYSEIGLVWVSWVTIAFLFLGGVVGFLLYNLDSKASIRIWRFLRKHRKAWKWIKDHKLDAKVPWNTSDEDVWEGGVDYKFDQMHDVIQFVKWLASRQFLLGSLFTAVFEELIFRGLLIFVLVLAFQSTVLAIVLSSLAFGLLHIMFGIQALPAKIFGGFVLGFLLVAGGTLLVPIVAHVVFNLLTWRSMKDTYRDLRRNLV